MQQPGLALLALAAWAALRPSAVIFPHSPLGNPYCISKAILPIASSCCTAVSHHVPRRLLDRVHTCRIQRADGDCDLAAVILHVRHRRICASPHSHTVKQWMKKQAAKKHANGHACHTKKHHGKRHSQGAHPARPGTRPPSSVLESEPADL